MLIGALSSVTGKGRTPAPAPPAPTYEQAILAIPDLVAIWPFAELAGTDLSASFGGFDGTYSGSPTFGAAPLPVGSIRSTNFGGVASAEVPHNAAFALSAWSFLIWFKATAPVEPELGLIYSKDQSGVIAGDYSVFTDAANALSVQFQSDTDTFVLPERRVLDPDTAYALISRADGTGFDGYLTGRYLGKNTSFTGAWAANTQPIRFATVPWTTILGKVTLAYAALWGRVITEAEVLALSQNTALPVAADIEAAVPESATTNIQVLRPSSWVGSNPTITPVLQPSGGDSVASSGAGIDKVAAYTAGAVSADTLRSFQYRLTDPNGQSPSPGTVRVTVVNTPTSAVSNANCFTFNETDVINVDSISGLVSAVNNAPPGRTIKLAPGTYNESGTSRSFNPRGTAANPIVVRPNGARGSVTITGARWSMANGSSRLAFANLYFSNGRITVNGSHHRVSRCRFRSISGTCVSVLAGTEVRVDHCDFTDWVSGTGQFGLLRVNDNEIGAGSSHDYLFDYNYFHDIDPTIDGNAQEFVGLQDASNAFDMTPGLIIDHNLFYRIGYFGNEGEIIGAKTRGIVLRFNTFLEIGTGYINAPRIGAEFEIRSNWFENTARSNFVMVRSNSPLVIGNRFQTGFLEISAGDIYFNPSTPLTPGVSTPYAACSDARVIGNIMHAAGTIRVGAVNFTQGGVDVPARRTNLHLNTVSGGGTAHTLQANQSGTTFNSDSEPFVAATKIAVPSLAVGDQVGMFAPDPLCSTGPQS